VEILPPNQEQKCGRGGWRYRERRMGRGTPIIRALASRRVLKGARNSWRENSIGAVGVAASVSSTADGGHETRTIPLVQRGPASDVESLPHLGSP
jgi:hypothetical protein